MLNEIIELIFNQQSNISGYIINTDNIKTIYMYNDVCNIERKLRKMKTELYIAGMY